MQDTILPHKEELLNRVQDLNQVCSSSRRMMWLISRVIHLSKNWALLYP